MSDDDNEHPTDPSNLSPPEGDLESGEMPAVAAVPFMPQTALEPRPNEYLDQAVFSVLAGMRRLDNIETAIADGLDRAVHRIGVEALERETARAKVVDQNIGAVAHELRGLRSAFEQLAPRVTGTESDIEQLRVEFDAFNKRLIALENK